MMPVCFTDNTGHTVVSGPQTVAGHFITMPRPVIVTDANGYNGGVFYGAPIQAKQTDENGFNTSVFYGHPMACVQVSKDGVYAGNSAFVAKPMAIVLL